MFMHHLFMIITVCHVVCARIVIDSIIIIIILSMALLLFLIN